MRDPSGEFIKGEVFKMNANLASLAATVEASNATLSTVAADVRANREDCILMRSEVTALGSDVSALAVRVEAIAEDCTTDHRDMLAKIASLESDGGGDSGDIGSNIDALTPGRLVTLAALGAIICLTVGGSCWVAQTGKLPTEFGQLAGQEAPAAVAEEPEPPALTAEELQLRKAEAREAAIEMFQEILGPDAE